MNAKENLKENLEAMNEMSNKGIERLNKLGELNMKAMEKIAARQMDAMNFLVEQSMRQMKLASEAKGYSEFVKGQVGLAKETSERLMEETKANLQIANEVRENYRAFVQEGMAEVSEEVRKAAPAA